MSHITRRQQNVLKLLGTDYLVSTIQVAHSLGTTVQGAQLALKTLRQRDLVEKVVNNHGVRWKKAPPPGEGR